MRRRETLFEREREAVRRDNADPNARQQHDLRRPCLLVKSCYFLKFGHLTRQVEIVSMATYTELCQRGRSAVEGSGTIEQHRHIRERRLRFYRLLNGEDSILKVQLGGQLRQCIATTTGKYRAQTSLHSISGDQLTRIAS